MWESRGRIANEDAGVGRFGRSAGGIDGTGVPNWRGGEVSDHPVQVALSTRSSGSAHGCRERNESACAGGRYRGVREDRVKGM